MCMPRDRCPYEIDGHRCTLYEGHVGNCIPSDNPSAKHVEGAMEIVGGDEEEEIEVDVPDTFPQVWVDNRWQ